MRVRLVIVPDEESEDIDGRSSDDLVRRGYVGDFAITGEPTNLHIGIQAKGVLAARILVHGRAAHGSTPWLGDNAVVKAIDVFRRIESMPFSRESSEMFDRPSINLGRIVGGDAPNKVPDACVMDVDIRYLPNQDPGDILEQIRAIPDMDVERTFIFPPAHVSRSNPYVRALCETVGPRERRRVGVGRARRRLRRGVVPARRHPGRRVRAVGRGPPRPRGVGLDPRRWPATGELLVDFVARRAGAAGRRRRGAAARGRGRSGVKDPERPPRVRPQARAARAAGRPARDGAHGHGGRPPSRCARSTTSLDTFSGRPRRHRRARARHPRRRAARARFMMLGSDARDGADAGMAPRSDTILLARADPDKDAIAVHVDPARPQGRDPRARRGQDQQRVRARRQARRPAARGRDGQEAVRGRDRRELPDHQRDDHGLRRLPPGRRTTSTASTSTSTATTSTTTRAGENYATIDIDPGYQKLKGQDALDYVRYRHTTTTSCARRASRTSCARPRTRPACASCWPAASARPGI